MKVCVIGLGYVGAVTASCFARDGHDVLGIDLDETKLELLMSGRAPIVEDGIDEVTREAAESGRLAVSQKIDERLAEQDVIFVCVGTPSAANGSQDLAAVERVSSQIGKAIRGSAGYPVVVMRSTVNPGVTEGLVKPIIEDASGGQVGDDFGLCFQPEFLREGSSVKDFYAPPFTVVGSDSHRSIDVVRDLFAEIDAEFIATDVANAELLKLACNAFHALKIGFSNEIGRLARSMDVDARDVMSILCRDTSLNISAAYMRPGFAFGGSCLPKDLRSLRHLAKVNDIDLQVLSGTLDSNERHIAHAARMVTSAGSRNVSLIGLSFKPGTDDLRESPLVSLAEFLIGKGYELRIYDPTVNVARLMGANKRFIADTIPHFEALMSDDLDDVLDHADTVVIGHSMPDVVEALTMSAGRDRHVVDLVGVDELQEGTQNYSGICW